MNPVNTLNLLGTPAEILIDGAMSQGSCTLMLDLTPPGGGPPPHSHSREDEVFTVLEGEYELLSEGQWVKVPVGEPVFGPRGHVHTFRNVGSTPGKMAIFISPAGIENFFEKLSGLSVPADMARIEALFAEYGLSLHLS